MLDYLKVKVLSLVEEAKIIRRHEYRRQMMFALANTKFDDKKQEFKRVKFLKKNDYVDEGHNQKIYNGLHRHRVFDVREETRSSHLAYGFLKGNAYHDMEERAENEPNWEKIQRLVMRYGEGDPSLLKLNIETWIHNAKEEWLINNILMLQRNQDRLERKKVRKDEQVLASV